MLTPTSSAPVTKGSSSLAPNSEKGQISIFFSASIVVLITIIAFVINIGLFVKAKINLQNATDAAAFSGAAVQARQLTTISYLNWEMRNIYKEWMFKYYVVGNLNINDVANPSSASGDAISFRLQETINPLETGSRARMVDRYSFPSVCIHLAGSQTNLCRRYSVPGLPEFGSTNLPGAEEASRAFINSLISTKILDCVDQTRLNMLVNLTWAYNVNLEGDETIVQQGPQILANRLGAWPKAVEVAMRIRNLERAVNRAPETTGVCVAQDGSTDIRCAKLIDQVEAENQHGNERIVKAFYSGYRNLGTSIQVDGESVDDEMKRSFTLTEIPPRLVDLGSQRSASYLLVPQDKIQNYQKSYLDLHLMMVNYATFYNAFIPSASQNTGGSGILGQAGACDVSKVAMPVPGYPMGFYKNPDILTYYAVKGEAAFTGMFNPFAQDAVKLTAYSAAKPFGGRVGPMLFLQRAGSEFFVGRNDSNKKRSIPYIASLRFEDTPNPQTGRPIALGEFAPGIPLPINFPDSYFWLKDQDSPLGGYIGTSDVQFGLPNMVYDYQTPYRNTGYTDASDNIHRIFTRSTDDKPIGLFSKFQLQQFKGTALSSSVSQEILEKELRRIKAPTLYETANYLVPSPEALNRTQNLDSVGFIPGQKNPNLSDGSIDVYEASIYAPLYSTTQADSLWTTSQDVVRTVFEFIREQESGIQKYKRSMIRAAIEIDRMGLPPNLPANASGARAGFTRAARGVADVDFSRGEDQNIGSCESLAGVFLHYFFGYGPIGRSLVDDVTGCPESLGENLEEYFNRTGTSSGFSASHYRMEYSLNTAMAGGTQSLFSAYMPGPFNGVGNDGNFANPIAGLDEQRETMRRNFYSTKFVQLRSLTQSGPWNETSSNFVLMSEGGINEPGQDVRQKQYRNSPDAESVGVNLNAISY